MTIVDVNLLLYAVNSDSRFHKGAKTWLEEILSGADTVGFAPTVLLAFLRLTTRPGIFEKPISPEKAFDLMERWMRRPSAIVAHPGPRHWQILRSLLVTVGTGGNLTSDAHLAALAIEYGATLYTNDRDFERFPGLKVQLPLSS